MAAKRGAAEIDDVMQDFEAEVPSNYEDFEADDETISSSDEEAEPAAKRVRLPWKQKPPMAYSQSRRRAACCGLSTGTFRALRRIGWPIVLFKLLWWMQANLGAPNRGIWMIEYFSDVVMVNIQWSKHGLRASSFDIIHHNQYESMLTPDGFLTSLRFATRLHRKGLAHWATVCST